MFGICPCLSDKYVTNLSQFGKICSGFVAYGGIDMFQIRPSLPVICYYIYKV